MSTVNHPGGNPLYPVRQPRVYPAQIIYVPLFYAYPWQAAPVEQTPSEPPADIVTYNGYQDNPEPPAPPPPVPSSARPQPTDLDPVPVPVERAPAAATSSYTLLVFKDHTIVAATSYGVENNKLSYDTSYGATNSIALEQLDLEFTIKLNNDRNVKFELREK